MDKTLFDMLKKKLNRDKHYFSLELLGNKAVGIGDHSTEDFYKNVKNLDIVSRFF